MIDVVVLFFLLGLLARLVKSDLALPGALYETLSIYLLLAIGLKGGVELSKQSLDAVVPQMLFCLVLGLLIPLLLYPMLRRLIGLNGFDAASVAAHYGSVSVVTFAVASAYLTHRNIPFESHAALWVALLEAPGIVMGIALARWSEKKLGGGSGTQVGFDWRALAHDVFLGKSVFLLVGGLVIGTMMGEAGTAPIAPLFTVLFKGVLALFLLELGLVAGGRLGELKRYGAKLIAFALLAPMGLAVFGALGGKALGLSTGGIAIMAALAASASYIAAPTAMRIAVPQANAALSITAALGVTFPFNVLLGIPLYSKLAQVLS
ncbi:MAG: sodium-dependent bicarbonate transport family permease [Polaromonas sp.]|jgi:hypothetical protein